MNNKEIMILEPFEFSNSAKELLKKKFKLRTKFDPSKSYPNVIAIFVRLKYQIDSKFLNLFPNVKYILSPTTGINHIDLKCISSKKISLISLTNEKRFLKTIPETADFTWGLIIARSRKIVASHSATINNVWERDLFKGNNLKGKKISFVGYGRIAKLMHKYAKAFDMDVQAYDPYVHKFCKGVKVFNSIEKMFIQSDIVSVNSTLSSETENLINKKNMKFLPKTAILINTSRGEILNHNDLLEALETQTIKGAAIDVLPEEQKENNKVKKDLISYAKNNSNLIITPHLGGATYESMSDTENFITKKFLKKASE